MSRINNKLLRFTTHGDKRFLLKFSAITLISSYDFDGTDGKKQMTTINTKDTAHLQSFNIDMPFEFVIWCLARSCEAEEDMIDLDNDYLIYKSHLDDKNGEAKEALPWPKDKTNKTRTMETGPEIEKGIA